MLFYSSTVTVMLLAPYIKENKGIVISLLITTLVIFILITILLPIIYTFFSVNVNTLPLSGNLFTLNKLAEFQNVKVIITTRRKYI